MGEGSQPDGRQRLAAVVALVAGALALVAVMAFTLGSLGNVLLSLVGVAIAVTGGWYFVAHRGTPRVVAAVIALLGAGMALLALLAARSALWGLLIAGVLLAISVYGAQIATRTRVDSVTAAELGTAHPAAQHPVLIMNPWSGGGKVATFNLVDECRARGIEPVVLAEGDDLVAARRGRDRARRGRHRHGRRRRLAGPGGHRGHEARAAPCRDPGGDAQPPRTRPRP